MGETVVTGIDTIGSTPTDGEAVLYDAAADRFTTGPADSAGTVTNPLTGDLDAAGFDIGDAGTVTADVVSAGVVWVGNSAAGSTPGTVIHKVQIFDAAGVSLGFVAVYDAIT